MGKKLFYSLLSILVVLALFAPSVRAQSRAVKVTTLPEDETVDKNYYIASGEVVEISGTVNGDVIVAGGQVFVDGDVKGDLLAAGGSVNVSGNIGQDLRVAGGQINVSGNIGKNVSIAGGDIQLEKDAQIGGGVIIAGGNVLLSAPISGQVTVAAGNVTVSDDINGDIDAYVGTLSVTSQANVNGNLTYTSDQKATVSQGASISGKLLQKVPPTVAPEAASLRNFAGAVQKIRLQMRIVSLISALIIGALMIKFLPNYTSNVADRIQSSFWRSLGVGFIVILVSPIAFILLMITVIGIPLGFIGLFLLIIYIYLAKIYVSVWIGNKIVSKNNKSPYVPLLLGLLIYYLVTLVWVVGGLVSLLTLFVGVGASIIECRNYFDKASKAKLM
jgi:predicted acyltransferase (DUF342 family)